MEQTKITAKDFFLHIGAIAALYTSVVALLILLFRVIDLAFPVMRTAVYYGSSSISFQVATLIVAFPIFVALTWLVEKGYDRDSRLKEVSVRKWLSYVTIFIAGAILAGDLITVIYKYLDGQELTTAFLLKVLALMIVAAGVFAYFLRDIKNQVDLRERKVWAMASGGLILLSIVLGFSVVGSPASQRAIRMDQERLSHMQSMQWQIVNYWQQKGQLPTSLNDLNDPISGFVVPTDPQTGESYEYARTGNTSFELCAFFLKEAPGMGMRYPSMMDSKMMYAGPDMPRMETWEHPAGRHCFERTIDPEFYPVRPGLR